MWADRQSSPGRSSSYSRDFSALRVTCPPVVARHWYPIAVLGVIGRSFASQMYSALDEPGSPSAPPPLTAQIMEPVRRLSDQLWPGAAIVPAMSTGATDGRFLNASGTPTYGLSGMFHDVEGPRAHGLNERIRVKSLMDGRQFLYEIVKIYANQSD
jgi:acetylornithine deacetylase/succinyl-diaminopimelate desuccinylase-like protein